MRKWMWVVCVVTLAACVGNSPAGDDDDSGTVTSSSSGGGGTSSSGGTRSGTTSSGGASGAGASSGGAGSSGGAWSGTGSSGGAWSGMGSSAAGSGAGSGGSATGASGSSGETLPSSSSSTIQPGTLTAGAWDDNLNFDYYLHYLARMAQDGLTDVPVVPRGDRLVVNVVDGAGVPVAGAQVTVSPVVGTRFATTTGGEGTALFFPSHAGVPAGAVLGVEARLGELSVTETVPVGTSSVNLVLATQAAPLESLDLALVMDTTGSMGDEMEYLKVELGAIAQSVQGAFPSVQTRWALVFYRDEGDDYVVRSFDFRADLASVQADLAAQVANGGNDYPEAVPTALNAMNQLSWRDGATARVAFMVADAPHHPGWEAPLVQEIDAARARGVHVYPVAGSGTDAVFEHTFRTVAQMTGGRYLFLTSDSGIGGEHTEPTIPCFVVTTLAQAMARMVRIELSGHYQEATDQEVLRVGGDPQDGRCTLEDGSQVILL